MKRHVFSLFLLVFSLLFLLCACDSSPKIELPKKPYSPDTILSRLLTDDLSITTPESLDQLLMDAGWTKFQQGDRPVYLGSAWQMPACLIYSEKDGLISSLQLSLIRYPNDREAEVSAGLSDLDADEWNDMRASSAYSSSVSEEMATLLLQARALVLATDATLTEGALRLSGTTVLEIAETIERCFNDPSSFPQMQMIGTGKTDVQVFSADFGEQYYLLPDGSYAGYSVAGGRNSGVCTFQLRRYSADYENRNGAKPQIAFYSPCEDVPISISYQ